MVVNRPGPRRGFALFMVLMAVLLLLAAGAVLALHVQARMALVRDQERNLQLQSLLDSGYALAAATLRDDYGYEGVEDYALGGGAVRVEVEYVVIAGRPGGRRVVLYASYRGETRNAEGLAFLPAPGAKPQLYGLRPLPADHEVISIK